MDDLAFVNGLVLRAWHDLPLGPVERGLLKTSVFVAIWFGVTWTLERLHGLRSSHYSSRFFLHDLAYVFYYRTGLHGFVFAFAILGTTADMAAGADRGLIGSLPFPLQALIYLVLTDFVGYWNHRAMHRFGWLWAFHSTHHSQVDLSFATTHRTHPIENLFTSGLTLLTLGLLGVHPAYWMPLFMLAEGIAMIQHSRVPWRFGVLYPLVASPVFHSFHHSRDSAHHDRNFASLLSMWDTLFGTAVKDARHAPTTFGLDDVVPTSLASTLITPFRMLRAFYGANAAYRK